MSASPPRMRAVWAGRRPPRKGGSSPCSPASAGCAWLWSRASARLSLRPLYARPRKTAPEGADAGTTPAGPPGQKEDRNHDQDNHPDESRRPRAPVPRSRAHHLRAGSPTSPRITGLADNLVRTFGLEPVDYDGIRDATEEHIARAAQAFGTALNEKALQIHLQRITGAFVGSAFGAAQFYGTKIVGRAELTSTLLRRRPRRRPRRSGRLREQGRACPPVRRRDGLAVLRADGRRRGRDLRLRRHHRRGLEALRGPCRTRRHRGPQVRRRRDGRSRVGVTEQARAEPVAAPPFAGDGGTAQGFDPCAFFLGRQNVYTCFCVYRKAEPQRRPRPSSITHRPPL